MLSEQQFTLLDNIAAGKCVYFHLCGQGGVHPRQATFVVNSLTLPVALRHGSMRSVTLDVKVCEMHK